MSIPVGLQLGVELTNFIAPLTKTALRLGSLAVREAIERSGSDELTELKLAHILGRHRLDPVIATHFRSLVARSGCERLSRFMRELVLESGAGATVTQALAGDNAALLSMVVQVSFLAWSLEHQSLALALTQAVEEMLISSETPTSHGLNYLSLLGTIGACQQQTAAFSWAHHYASIDDKIYKALRSGNQTSPSSSFTAKERPAKRRRTVSSQMPSRTYQQAVADRALPYVILKGLVKALDSVQRFPEECLLQLSCDRGISSVVLWCYHILGISVLVRMGDVLIHFGTGPYNVTIEPCAGSDVSAVLLQRAAENVPIFTLTRADSDPYIQTDERVDARGFLKKILTLRGVDDDEIGEYGAGVVSECIRHLDIDEQGEDEPDTIRVGAFTHTAPAGSEASSVSGDAVAMTSMNHMLRSKISSTVAFLLDKNLDEMGKESIGLVSTRTRKKADTLWPTVIALIYAFARVSDLNQCSLLPLSLDAFEGMTVDDHGINFDKRPRGPVPDTICCFLLLSKLLMGSLYTKDYMAKAFLISSRGWSIFLDTIDASDPEDAGTGSLHVRPGVPARDGIRKARIIDGMTDFGIDATRELLFSSEPRISFWPGVWTAKTVGTHIGYHGHDAFTIVQMYDWAHSGQTCKKWRLGFREKQEMAMKFHVLKSCPCLTQQTEVERRRTIEKLLIWPAAAKQEAAQGDTSYIVKHPDDQWSVSRIPERIFYRGETWFFFVTGDSSARWLGLDNLEQLGLEGEDYRLIVRGRECCVSCAMEHVRGPALVLL
jgi:hypothetical protein